MARIVACVAVPILGFSLVPSITQRPATSVSDVADPAALIEAAIEAARNVPAIDPQKLLEITPKTARDMNEARPFDDVPMAAGVPYVFSGMPDALARATDCLAGAPILRSRRRPRGAAGRGASGAQPRVSSRLSQYDLR